MEINSVFLTIIAIAIVSIVISSWQTADMKVFARNSELTLEAYNYLSDSISNIEKNHANLLIAYIEDSIKKDKEIEDLKKKIDLLKHQEAR